MADEQGRTFEDVHERLSEIVDEIYTLSLHDALPILDAFLATEEEGESSPAEEGGASTAPTGSTDTTSSADAPAPGEA